MAKATITVDMLNLPEVKAIIEGLTAERDEAIDYLQAVLDEVFAYDPSTDVASEAKAWLAAKDDQ